MIRYRFVCIIALFFLGVFIFMGCFGKNDESHGINNGKSNVNSLIDEDGIFNSKTGKYKLAVEINNDSIVHYKVIENNREKTLFSENAGSLYQKWYLVWDSRDRLWVHSSDIGSVVWFKNSKGVWVKKRIVKDDGLFKEMPRIFKDNLPVTLKRRWGIEK